MPCRAAQSAAQAMDLSACRSYPPVAPFASLLQQCVYQPSSGGLARACTRGASGLTQLDGAAQQATARPERLLQLDLGDILLPRSVSPPCRAAQQAVRQQAAQSAMFTSCSCWAGCLFGLPRAEGVAGPGLFEQRACKTSEERGARGARTAGGQGMCSRRCPAQHG